MTPQPKPRGRPPGSTGKAREAQIPAMRCTPEERAKYERLGASKWLREALKRAREPLSQSVA